MAADRPAARNAPGRQLDLSIGYSNQWKALSYSVNFQRTRDSIDFGRGALQDSIPGVEMPAARAQQARVDNRLAGPVQVDHRLQPGVGRHGLPDRGPLPRQQDDRERGVQAGADAYLVKPFSPMELLELVRRWSGA